MERKEIYGAGFEYPFSFSEETGGVASAIYERSVVASLIRLFDTAPGEEFMLPAYGCALKLMVFENDTEAFRAMAVTAIREAVARWEPRVDQILSIELEEDPDDDNRILIRIFLTLIKNQEVYNFVYPFQLPE